MTAVQINRLQTGVPGLDQVLGGGIPEYSFNLIAGLPGCGKTTLAHQLMFGLATPERPALYFTVLGEPPLKMLRYQQQFEFFDTARVSGSVNFVNLGEEVMTGDLGRVLDRIVAEVRAHAPALVFVAIWLAAITLYGLVVEQWALVRVRRDFSYDWAFLYAPLIALGVGLTAAFFATRRLPAARMTLLILTAGLIALFGGILLFGLGAVI